jgi:hypothetical protein
VAGLLSGVAGMAFTFSPVLTAGAALAGALAAAVMLHPPVAAYLVVSVTLLTAGMPRGDLSLLTGEPSTTGGFVPLLRPSEAITLLVGAGLLARGLVRTVSHGRPSVRFTPVDAALLLFVVSGSLLPLLWMGARARPITADDFLYAISLWRLYAVFLIVRTSVRSDAQVRRCLVLAMMSAAVVAVVAILQSLELFGVPQLMARYYPREAGLTFAPNRGTSTLGSSLITGNVMAFNLGLAFAFLAARRQRRGMMIAASALFIVGALATGQFSAVIALLVVVGAVGFLTGQLTKRLLMLLPTGLVAAILLQPVIESRLARINPEEGLPTSWLARLDNLRNYFWPELFSNFNYVLGVRPAARLPSNDPSNEFVWIESGHTWLLWAGGIPMFVAFFVFVVVAVRALLPATRGPKTSVSVAAVAALSALAVVAVLMAVDPQLTGRGASELLFSLIALGLVRPAPPPRDRGDEPAREAMASLVTPSA